MLVTMCDKWSARGRQKSRIDSVYLDEFGGAYRPYRFFTGN